MIVRSRDALVAAILALATLFGGLPIVTGRSAADSHPAFTLNICHPLQAADTVAAPCNLPAPRAEAIIRKPEPVGLLFQPVLTMNNRPAEAPDSPPPRALA